MTTHHFQGHTLFQGLLFLQEVLTEVHTIIFQSRCHSQSQNLRGREIEETLSNSAEKIPFSWLLFGSCWKKQHWGGLQWNTLGRKSPDSLDWSDTQSILFFKALPSFSSSTTSSDEAVVPAAVHFHSKHNLPCSCGEGLSPWEPPCELFFLILVVHPKDLQVDRGWGTEVFQPLPLPSLPGSLPLLLLMVRPAGGVKAVPLPHRGGSCSIKCDDTVGCSWTDSCAQAAMQFCFFKKFLMG